ncbi:hypothetical protein JCM6882_004051 [Rhodosporidiobolus microsporus]
MPRSSRSQPTQDDHPEQPDSPSSSKQRLAFAQPLRGASLSNHELTKRLKSLHHELRDLDQDAVDTSSLDTVARDLIHPGLLLHKDKGVKAFVGCCLVDVLRLYAPDAPYTPKELNDLFDFLIRLFRFVGSPNDPHQAEYFFIVDSLASVKSIVIVCDLDQADELVERVFRESFDTISSTSPKNVEIALSDVLLSLLEELPSIPSSVTEILLSQFLPRAIRARPSAFRLATDVCKGASDTLQRYVSMYFAEVLVEGAAGSGGRGKGRGGSSDFEEEDSDEDEEDEDDDEEAEGGRGKKRKAARKAAKKGKAAASKAHVDTADGGDLPSSLIRAHDLIRSLHRHVPSLLLSIIPQLEAELVSSHPSYRRLATACLGSMFGEPSRGGAGAGDLASAFPGCWREWGRRSADRDAKVRGEVAERVGKVWREHAELGKEVEALILRLLLDTDERVRLAAVSVFDEGKVRSKKSSSSSNKGKEKEKDAQEEENRDPGMDYETAAHHVSRRVLEAVGERVRDKKEKVRAVAFKALGRLYDLAYPEIENRDDHAIRHFGWIPETLLDALKFVDPSAPSSTTLQRHLLDSSFSTHILPRPRTEKDAADADTVASWVDRFLVVERGVRDETHRAALMGLTRLAERRGAGSLWEGFVQCCERYNSGIVDDKNQLEPLKEFLKRSIGAIAAQMPDPARARDDLHAFAKQNVQQMYRELRVMWDVQTDLKTFVKNERDFLRRLEKFPSPSSALQTFTAFVRLSCPTYLTRSSISQLLKRLQGGVVLPSPSSSAAIADASEADLFATSAARVLEYVSRTKPVIFKTHMAELGKILSGEEVQEKVVEVVLHAVAKLKRAEEGLAIDGKLSKRALHFAQSGTEKQAKQAATLVALDSARAGTADDLVDHLATALPSATDKETVSHFAALARVARYGREAFETKSEAITTVALEVLTRAGGASENPADEDDDLTWVDSSSLVPVTRARELSIKILLNRCLAYAGTDSAAKVAKPVFQLLWPLVQVQGGGEETYSVPVASRLRLASALAILKLLASQDAGFIKSIVPHLDILSRLCQDACFEVREHFLKKLVQYLREKRIHQQILPRVNMFVFLAAHEPEEDLKEIVVTFAKTRQRLPDEDRQQLWETPFLRLVHMLAHHPDFEGDEHDADELKGMAKYLEMYFETFATAENIGFLFYLAGAVKTVKDRKGSEWDANLYTLSELSQHLLKQVAKRHGWPISTHPGQVNMPADLFVKFDSPEQGKKIAARSYIDENVLAKLEVKPEKKKAPTRKRVSTSAANGAKPKRARTSKSTSKPRGKSAAAKKKGEDWDSDEEQSPDEDSSDDEEDDSDADAQPKKNGAAKKKPTPRGQRGNLRSDPKKDVVKGLGESSDEDEDEDGEEMDVDGTGSSGSGDEVVVANGKSKTAAKAKGKGKAASASPPPKSPAKGKKAATPSKAKASPAKKASASAKSPAKGKKAAKAKKGDEDDSRPRRALRGLNQPRSMKKGLDAEEVSDVSDLEDGAGDEEMASASGEE